MKKFTLLLSALLMVSFSALAQIKLVVCQEGGARSEFIASSVDSIIFVGLEDTPDVPVKPDDGDDDIDTPEVELPGEGKIRFIVDATAVDACYGVGFVGKFCNWDPNQTFQGTEFAENMFYIDMPSMTAEEFGNARILLLHEDGTSSWDYQVSSNGYDITGSEDYITLIDEYGDGFKSINIFDDIDNVIIKVAILEVDDTPCKPDVPAGYAKFVLTVTGNVPAGKDVIFTGSFEEKLWGESDRVMTKQADGTYVWEGAYPENFQFKAFIADCEDLGFGEDDYGYSFTELWLEGANRLVELGSGSVIEFEGCFEFLCPEDDDPVVPGTGGFVAKPFSVSSSKTVTFSPGNLQYHAVNDEWRFAPSQLDYIGYDNANISSTYNGWIDLFGWGTGDNPTNKSTDYYDYQTFVDWGVNKIGSYSPNTWRTLTYDEWYYLRWERPNYDKLIGVAQVNGINGLILLPDAWVCPSGVTFKAGFHNDWCTECYGNYQTISALEWSKLETSGAVFLPAAGYRTGSDVYGVQGYGSYWSATEGGSGSAGSLDFNSAGAYVGYDNRYYGQSVRLVQDVATDPDDSDKPGDTENPDEDELVLPKVAAPGEGYTTIVLYIPESSCDEAVPYILGELPNGDWTNIPDLQMEFLGNNWWKVTVDALNKENATNFKFRMEDGEGGWSFEPRNSYELLGDTYEYLSIIVDWGVPNNLRAIADCDNQVLYIKSGKWRNTPCREPVPSGHAKFIFTLTGVNPGKDIIFTGNFEENPWYLSDRIMTKQADGTYVWEGDYPENFRFKVIAKDAAGIGTAGEDGVLWLDGDDRVVEAESGSVIKFEGCFMGLCSIEDVDIPVDTPVVPSDGSFVAKPFSVSATKTVTFSPGNLQYHAANNEWRFAPSQLDYIGDDNANISDTYNGWIDLFGWGTGNNSTNASKDKSDYQTFVDWGVNKIGNYAPNTWRTLTYAEWYYLRWERPNYDKLIGIAEVNGVNGLILLPDAWVCPSGVTFKSGFDDDYCTECYGNNQTISALEWSKLEASGAVFLPAAGSRGGSDVYSVQGSGYYWSATEYYSDNARFLYFDSDVASMYGSNSYDGHSVRLVQD